MHGFGLRRTSKQRLAQPPETAIKAFQEGLSASRVGYSNIIEISYTSSSPKRAAEIANAVAKAYIADQLNAKLDANRIATGWLQERLRDLDEQALTAERAIGAFKSQNNIVATSGGSSIEEQKLTDINNRLTAARGQASEALVKLNRYETILRSNSLDTASIRTLDVGGPDANGINSIREKYLELARSESDLSARFGPDHRAVIDLGTRMRDLRMSILDEVRRLAGAAKGEFELLEAASGGTREAAGPGSIPGAIDESSRDYDTQPGKSGENLARHV